MNRTTPAIARSGFTLIELMIVVAIVAILASIAVPSYHQFVQEARRTDAKQALLGAQLLLEEYRIGCSQYGQSPADCQSGTPTSLTSASLGAEDGSYYTYTLTATSATTYTLTATAKGSQTNDKVGTVSCTPMTLNQNDAKTPAECW